MNFAVFAILISINVLMSVFAFDRDPKETYTIAFWLAAGWFSRWVLVDVLAKTKDSD